MGLAALSPSCETTHLCLGCTRFLGALEVQRILASERLSSSVMKGRFKHRMQEIMPRKTAKRKQPSRVIRLSAEPTGSDIDAAFRAAKITGPTFTRTQLLGFILKLVLKDRITDEEIDLISSTYQDRVTDWWGD
jgi:hypothetical protein